MRPNIFIHYRDYPEDFFSRSFAYITNLFPVIGQKLIQRIAVLSGNKPDYFGEFKQCEFIGHKFQDKHRDSKPDLKISCSDGVLYFENKLESSLNIDQMERHANLVADKKKYYLLFVSNILHKNECLRSLPGYIHPMNADHYLWLDFLPVFQNSYRRDSLAYSLLSDFNNSMKANGMIGRRLKGANGSIYTNNSDACHLALNQLWNLLHELGFKLTKKSVKEATIRAYPVKNRQYPLLNPRFEPTAVWLDEAWDRECIDFTVLSKGCSSFLDKKLDQFCSTKECAFIFDRFESSDGYNYHGHFLVPLQFKGNPAEIVFSSLKKPLLSILYFLQN